MATFTVSINQELKDQTELYPEINWAEYLKKRFEFRLENLKKQKRN